MILNPFKCEKCKIELQPEDILIEVHNGELIRVCKYCRHKVIIKEERK